MSFARSGRRAAKRCVVTADLCLLDRALADRIGATEADGSERVQSQREGKRWIELKLLERASRIRGLRRQIRFNLHCPSPLGPAQVTYYTADFAYNEAGVTGLLSKPVWRPVVEDCKGYREREYLLRKKWVRLEYGIVLRET